MQAESHLKATDNIIINVQAQRFVVICWNIVLLFFSLFWISVLCHGFKIVWSPCILLISPAEWFMMPFNFAAFCPFTSWIIKIQLKMHLLISLPLWDNPAIYLGLESGWNGFRRRSNLLVAGLSKSEGSTGKCGPFTFWKNYHPNWKPSEGSQRFLRS